MFASSSTSLPFSSSSLSVQSLSPIGAISTLLTSASFQSQHTREEDKQTKSNTDHLHISNLPALDTASAFGELVPYGDPNWYQNWRSPYYNQSHVNFRKALRTFCEDELAPHVFDWDEAKQIPKEIWRKFGAAGFLPGVIGSWPTEYVGDKIAGNVRPEEFDYFHELIIHDEVSRLGSGGQYTCHCCSA